MSGKRITFFNVVAILSVSFMYMAVGSLLAPALNAIAESFPDSPFTTVQLVMTSSYLTIALFSLVSGALASKFSRKAIAEVGLLIYGVSALVGANLGDLTLLIVDRFIMGAGCGLLLPQATAIIVDLFDGQKRERMLGFSTGVANFGALLGSLVGGYFAAIDWSLNFYGFAITLVIFIIVLFGVPKMPVGKGGSIGENVADDGAAAAGESLGAASAESVTASTPRSSKGMPSFLIVLAIAMFFVQVYGLTTPTNMAKYYLTVLHGPVELLGVTMAAMTFFAFVAGFVLVYVRKLFRSYTPVVACLLTGCGFVLLSQATSWEMALASNVLIGFANGVLMPCIFVKNAELVSPAQRNMSTAVITCGMYLGEFVCPYLQQFGNFVMGDSSQAAMFLFFGIAAFAITVLVLGCIVFFNRRKATRA